jgi:hypothetical protein
LAEVDGISYEFMKDFQQQALRDIQASVCLMEVEAEFFEFVILVGLAKTSLMPR